MTKQNHFTTRLFRVLAATVASASLLSVANAADFTYDANTTPPPNDGAGTWNVPLTNWFDGANDVAWGNTFADTAFFGVGGAGGTVTVAAVNAGGITFNAVSTGYTLASGTITLGAGSIISNNNTVANAINPTINSVLSGSNIVFQASAGNLQATPNIQIGSSNILSGTTTVGGGSNKLLLLANTIASLGGSTSTILVSSGNTLRLGTTGNFTNNLNLVGTGQGGRGALSFGASTTVPTTVSGTVTLAGNALITNANQTGAGIISGNIGQSVASQLTVNSVVQQLTLSGSNTYTGGTIINPTGAGGFTSRVLVNNTAGSATGSGAVSVTASGTTGAVGFFATLSGGNGASNGGASSILGTGTNTATSQTYAANVRGIISGTTTIATLAHLAPGDVTQSGSTFTSTVGTLTTGGLVLSGSSVLDYEFEFNGTPTNDFTAVTNANALTLTGGRFNLFLEGTTNQLTTGGLYNLLDYTGTLGGSVANLSVLNPVSGYSYTFINNTTDTLVQLQVVIPEPTTFAMLLGGMGMLVGFQRRRRH